MTVLAPLQAQWARLAPREQTLVRVAASLVALAVLWWLLLAPALQTLRSSGARHAEAEAQWQQMQQLQAEAEQLLAAPKHEAGDAPEALRSATEKHLGAAARITLAAGRATVTLTDVPAAPLAAWLAQVRGSAQAAPVTAQLTRTAGAAPARWSGTLVLNLPTSP